MDSTLDLKNAPTDTRREFEAVFILRKCSSRTARNGAPFLVIELGDCHGSFQTTCFSDGEVFPVLSEADEGDIVRVKGHTDYYQERLSPRLYFAEVVEPEVALKNGWMENLVQLPPEPMDSLRADFEAAIESVAHAGLRQTIRHVLEDVGEKFFLSSAAVSMHHAYQGGLLEHTTRMARAARALLPLYPEVNADLAMTGILLHDIGKVLEYETTLTTRRTRIGILQGHVVLGYRLVRKAALIAKLEPELCERLEHIILSHQGELEWGAAAMAATPEAVFVSMIDNLDARMGMVQQALREANSEKEFSDYLPGLKAPLLVTPLEEPPASRRQAPASSPAPRQPESSPDAQRQPELPL